MRIAIFCGPARPHPPMVGSFGGSGHPRPPPPPLTMASADAVRTLPSSLRVITSLFFFLFALWFFHVSLTVCVFFSVLCTPACVCVFLRAASSNNESRRGPSEQWGERGWKSISTARWRRMSVGARKMSSLSTQWGSQTHWDSGTGTGGGGARGGGADLQ